MADSLGAGSAAFKMSDFTDFGGRFGAVPCLRPDITSPSLQYPGKRAHLHSESRAAVRGIKTPTLIYCEKRVENGRTNGASGLSRGGEKSLLRKTRKSDSTPKVFLVGQVKTALLPVAQNLNSQPPAIKRLCQVENEAN